MSRYRPQAQYNYVQDTVVGKRGQGTVRIKGCGSWVLEGDWNWSYTLEETSVSLETWIHILALSLVSC